jgi:hypothetical protein
MKKRDVFLFFAVILTLSWAYRYGDYVFREPFSIHTWRQSDCASMTQNYYAENLPFLEPKIHAQIAQEGRGMAEFPVFYYVSAQCWKIFGKNVFWNRFLNCCFVFTGLFFLFKLSLRVLKNNALALIVLVIVFSSPVITFYTNNFMSNAPALASLFIGWYFLYDYYHSGKNWTLVWAFSALVLATLLRSTMMIGYFAIYIVLLFELFNFKRFGLNNTDFFKNKSQALILGLLSVLIIFSWYFYVNQYNSRYHSGYFLTTIRPIWESDKVTQIVATLIWENLHQLHSVFFLILSLLFLVFHVVRCSRYPSLVNISIFSTLFGTFCYTILWFHNFEHDYYLIDYWIFLIPNMMVFLYYFSLSSIYHSLRTYWRTLLVIGLLFASFRAVLYQQIKYDVNTSYAAYNYLLPRKFVEYCAWWQWYYDTRYKPLTNITPYLRSLGIQRDDDVVCLPDGSPNTSLYLMDQKGFTSLYYDLTPLDEMLQDLHTNKKAQYLIIVEEEFHKKEELQKYLHHPIGQRGNVYIYKL